MVAYAFSQLFLRVNESIRLARAQLWRPPGPVRRSFSPLDGQKHRKILKPERLRVYKSVEFGLLAA